MNFTRALRGQGFAKKTVVENMHNLVDKEDYNHLLPVEKKELMRWLESVTRPLEDG